MSTITIFARGDRALMLTDTAGTDARFTVRSWVNKVATVPHLRLAMTTQGAAEALPTFADRLTCELGGLDAIVRNGAAVLEDEHDLNVMRWSDGAASPEFRLGLVGWSEERSRFEAYLLQSTAGPGVPPYTFVRRDVVLAPAIHAQDLRHLRIPEDGVGFAANAQAHLLRLITLQRHVTTPRPGADAGDVGHVVGGSVVATELTRDGIAQRIVHAWPDRIDEPIRPLPLMAEIDALPGSALCSPSKTTSPMTRQQRRAAGAQARRAEPVA